VPLESLDPASKRIPFEVSDVAWADVPRVANGKETGKADIDGNDHHINGESDIYGAADIDATASLLLLRLFNADR
jgi:hypothetical protein